MPPRLSLSGLLVASSAALTLPATAAWQPDGTPLTPAPVGFQSYSMQGLVADGAGGAYTVWMFQQPLPDFSGTNFSLAAQRVDILGNRPAAWAPGGTVFKSWLDSNPTGTRSVDPVGTFEDGSGGALHALIDHAFIVEYLSLFRVFAIAPGGAASLMGPRGAIFGGYPVLSAAADGDGAGGVVMIGREQTFSQPPNSPGPGRLFVQRLDATGNALWPDDGLGSLGPVLVPVGQDDPSRGLAALSDGAGGAFFAWVDKRETGDPDVYVQRIDATGAVAAGWPAGGVQVCGAAGNQSEPHLASDGAGGLVVEWRDERDDVSRVYLNGVLATGALAPGIPADGRRLPSSGPGDSFVSLTSDGQGGCFVVRATITPTLVGLSCLHRLDGTMQPRAGWPAEGITLNTLSPGAGAVGLLPDGLGGVFVSYRNGFGSLAPQGLYAKHFAGDGTPAPDWTSDGYRLSGYGQQSAIVRSGAGAIVGWTDTRPALHGVYAQRLVPDGPVATQLSLVSAETGDGVVRLRWQAADGTVPRATLERRDEESDWVALDDVLADASGLLTYDDRSVLPGQRYGYRLSWSEGTASRTSPEAWVRVPGAVSLALAAPRPNPSSGPITLAIVLPDSRPARLEVVDVSGRSVLARDLAGLGAGPHQITLSESAGLAPGLYFIRLGHGGTWRETRCLRVR